jgi:hypothetical protein
MHYPDRYLKALRTAGLQDLLRMKQHCEPLCHEGQCMMDVSYCQPSTVAPPNGCLLCYWNSLRENSFHGAEVNEWMRDRTQAAAVGEADTKKKIGRFSLKRARFEITPPPLFFFYKTIHFTDWNRKDDSNR